MIGRSVDLQMTSPRGTRLLNLAIVHGKVSWTETQRLRKDSEKEEKSDSP